MNSAIEAEGLPPKLATCVRDEWTKVDKAV